MKPDFRSPIYSTNAQLGIIFRNHATVIQVDWVNLILMITIIESGQIAALSNELIQILIFTRAYHKTFNLQPKGDSVVAPVRGRLDCNKVSTKRQMTLGFHSLVQNA